MTCVIYCQDKVRIAYDLNAILVLLVGVIFLVFKVPRYQPLVIVNRSTFSI